MKGFCETEKPVPVKIDQYLKRIEQIDTMIKCRRTGPPEELAHRLGLSPSTVYNYINFMKKAGAPIAYSKKRRTYYYLYTVEFNFGFSAPQG